MQIGCLCAKIALTKIITHQRERKTHTHTHWFKGHDGQLDEMQLVIVLSRRLVP